MQITIKNIGNIKEAHIDLNGLSVIAGSNDSGKSTVNKLVFSVIKAFQRYKYEFNISKEEVLEERIGNLYRFLRFALRTIERNENSLNLNSLLKQDFYPPTFLNELGAFGNVDLFNEKKNKILNIGLDKKDEDTIIEYIENIKSEFLKDEKKEDLIKKALINILENEFENQLNNEQLGKKGIIEMDEHGILLFKIIIENNKVSEVKINDDILKIKDTTFIDSPITLNLFNYSIDNLSIPGRRAKELQFHIKDLFSKVRNSKFEEEKENIFLNNVKDIIGGVFKIIKKGIQEYLVFKKEGSDIDPINTATGIKSFGILDILDKSNCLTSSNLLILDEPEVHLHPEWQVKYAQLIVELIKERDVSVLITSHSPYLIEALDKYTREKGGEYKAHFYLSTKSEKGGYVIEDKTTDKNAIFQKLSEPFEQLIWSE